MLQLLLWELFDWSYVAATKIRAMADGVVPEPSTPLPVKDTATMVLSQVPLPRFKKGVRNAHKFGSGRVWTAIWDPEPTKKIARRHFVWYGWGEDEQGVRMIARLWHGWTSERNASAYEALLRSEILPGIHRIAGFRGAELLRRDLPGEVEFITVTFFDDVEAVRAFAGEDYELAVVPAEARTLLSRFDERSAHYQTIARMEF
jgi:heme-degrading monooxygenase HmoA